MADIVEKLVIKGDSSEAQKATDDMEANLTASFAKGVIAAELLQKAFSKTLDILKESVAQAIESEQAHIKQGIALEALGGATGIYAEKLRAQAQELKNLSGIDDDIITKTQTLAINFGVSADNVDKYVRAAIEMSNVTGQDLNSAMMGLIKTQEGMIDRTLKAIPGMNDLTKAQLANGDAIDLVNKQWGKFADAQLKGTGGELRQFTLAWEDLEKAIGRVIIGFRPLINGMQMLTSLMKGSESESGLSFTEQMFAITGMLSDEQVSQLLDQRYLEKRMRQETGAALVDIQGNPIQPSGGGFKRTPKGEGKPLDYTDEMLAGIKAEEDKAALIAKLEDRIEKGKNEIYEDNLKTRIKLTNEYAEEEIRINQEKNRIISIGLQDATGLMVDLLENAATGSKQSYQKILAGFVQMVGKQLIAEGSANILKGTARGLSSWGFDPTAYGLITTGGIEVGTGMAMVAGGAAWQGSISGGHGGGSGSGASVSGAGSYQSSMGTGSPSSTTGSQSGERHITIMVDGNLSPAETGLYVKKALDAATKEGLIT